MESKQITLMNLFSGQQWRNRPVDIGGGGTEKVRGMDRVTQKFTVPYVKQIANGNLLCDSGNSNMGSVTI